MKVLRGLLKFLGYSVFFLVALIFFVYMTLPLGEVEDYLVRKAADEFNADLTFNEDDSLDTCGLTCVEATNVTVKFRASPEEQAEYDAKRTVYLDWKKAQRAAAQGKTGAGGSAGAPASEAAKTPEGDTDSKAAKVAAKVDAKNAPERPENPSKTVELDRLKLAAAPLKLIGGAVDGTLEAELIGGTINATIVQGEDEIDLDATIKGLDASKLDVLRKLLELPIVGTLGSEIDLQLPITENAKGKKAPDLTALSGTIGLSLDNVAVGPGQIKTNSKTGFPFFDVPKTRITRLGGQIVFARKRATFEKFKISGKDLEGELTGYATLMSKLDDWRLNAHLNLKFSDAFLTDNRDVKVAMSSSPYLRRGQSNGYTGFNIHGTVGKVKFRPRKKAATSGSRDRTKKTSRASKRPRKTKTAIDRKGRTKKARNSRSKIDRPSGKRTAATARVASPTVRKGRSTADEPEPEDEEPEPEDEEPESDEPEGSEDDDEKPDDAKDGDDEEGDGDGGDDEEKDDKDDKEEKEE